MSEQRRSNIERQLRRIEDIVAEHPEGITRAELEEALGGEIHKRTLQRRLCELAEIGKIGSTGGGAATAYRPVTRPPSPSVHTELGEPEIPLSPTSLEVLHEIRQAPARRAPVGYKRVFLEDYVPGRTTYLSDATRRRLASLGSTTATSERPAGTVAQDVLEHLLIDLSWASSHLEGNTYSRLDTANLIEFGQQPEGKDATEAQMILNHKRAIEMLVKDAERVDFDRWTLLTLHAILGENLMAPSDEGRLRQRMVQITGTTYMPVAIPQVIEECFDLLLQKARAIENPFEQAFFAMVHLPYLQPFVDVNKRTSRLAANIPLIKRNLLPLSFVDVPRRLYTDATLAVYELRRIEPLRDLFAWAYERSCAQYRVIRDAVVEPDPIRFRYRDEIGAVVRAMVAEGRAPSVTEVQKRAQDLDVRTEDRPAFVERALDVLANLSEGSAGRYRITPEQWRDWEEYRRR